MEKTADEIWLEKHGPTLTVDMFIAEAADRVIDLGDPVEHDPLDIEIEI